MKKFSLTYKLFLLLIIFGFADKNFSQEIFVSKLADLDFGDVFIGTVNVDMPYTDANAAKFTFYFTSKKKKQKKRMHVSFLLPANLVFSGNNLPITFDQAHAAWNDEDLVSTATTFDPHAGFRTKNVRAKKSQHWVWIGANIPNTAGYPSGLYTGTITMTVEF